MTLSRETREMARRRLAAALGVSAVSKVFPWQLVLLDRLLDGAVGADDRPLAIDVPTGLGKTATMAIWLVARAAGAEVPRRLVYVVDRRAVVDQATEVADGLRTLVENDPALKQALGLDRPLPISTLRGQFADNREWMVDPSVPAIVLGTVDMVGSRLLFEGYGVSRKMRPYAAGLLGVDSLIVLDEAHLVAPFEQLIERIARGVAVAGREAASPVPRLRLLSLSATGRGGGRAREVVGLTKQDHAHCVVSLRLTAAKRLVLRPEVAAKLLASRVADEAWQIAAAARRPVRCAVFCDRRTDAQAVADALRARPGVAAGDVELLVGARRVHERTQVTNWLLEHGFLPPRPGAQPPAALERPAFVVATAAGEVGVDLDADHMVADLVAWERMVQRLGRVNRRGEGDAQVVVIPAAQDDAERTERLAATAQLIHQLPHRDDAYDASPGALSAVRAGAAALITRASTPAPLHPPLTMPAVEAWSMTSLIDHTGRSDISPWLRGWVDEEPQTTVVWRAQLPIRRVAGKGELLAPLDLETFFDAAGPHLDERLETETSAVITWLEQRAHAWQLKRGPSSGGGDDEAAGPSVVAEGEADVVEATGSSGGEAEAAALGDVGAGDDAGGDGASSQEEGGAGGVARPWSPRDADIIGVVVPRGKSEAWALRARDLLRNGRPVKEVHGRLEARLGNAVVMVDARIGGLRDGLLAADAGIADASAAAALDLVSGERTDSVVPVRVRRTEDLQDEAADPAWRHEARIAIDHGDDGDEVAWLLIDSDARIPAESANGPASGRAQLLDEHQAWTAAAARRIARRLELAPADEAMLVIAARLHDEGKRAKRWQRAFRAPQDGVYGKTASRPNQQVLGGYRHELGSLPRAERDPQVQALDAERRELCLHLIAAHHGNARCVLPTQHAEEPESLLERRAQDVALRFTQLSQRLGPWMLAWWETLLRAADQQASRSNDRAGDSGAPLGDPATEERGTTVTDARLEHAPPAQRSAATPAAEASIPVDLFNPGQVLACLGFMEAAQALCGGAEATFDWSDPGGARFWLRAPGARSPFATVLGFVARAEVIAELPEGSTVTAADWRSAWGALRLRPREDGYPYADPASAQTAVCVLRHGEHELRIDSWGDGSGRDPMKLWAGSGGYPGAALARDALELVRDRAEAAVADPFSVSAPQSSSFRLDWRRDYIPLDAGFSLNEHSGRIEAVGYPLVELLAAIGLGHARPQRPDPRDKLKYVYGVIGHGAAAAKRWLPPAMLRAALGAPALPFSMRRFRIQLGWPGKEGRARAMTTVMEETKNDRE